MKLKSVLLAVVLASSYSFGQLEQFGHTPGKSKVGVATSHGATHEKCGFDLRHREMLKKDPAFAQRVKQQEEHYQKFLKNPVQSKATYTIPVVVHVIHTGQAVGVGANISTAQIESAITNLNAAYSNTSTAHTTYTGVDTDIQFCLAQRDASGNPTTGILRVDGSGVTQYSTKGICDANGGTGTNNEDAVKALSKWDNTKYYNIWIVTEINDNNAGAGTQGYAYFPGASSAKDGAVMLYNSFGYDPDGSLSYNLKSYTNRNITFVHEMGHALSLYHTFEGDKGTNNAGSVSCPTQSDGCTYWDSDAGQWVHIGDCVTDTPPHQRSNSDCNSGGTNSCDGNSSNALFVHNFMDYSSDVCQTEFTAGQKTRLTAAMTGDRSSLTTSDGCNPVYALDVGVHAIVTPTSTNCGGSYDPVVTIKNYGSTTVTSMTISYNVDGGTPVNYNWTGSLASNAQTDVTLSSYSGTSGSHTFNVSVSSPNSSTDAYSANDASSLSYTATPPGPTSACAPSTTSTGNFGTGIDRVQFVTIDNAHTANSNDGTQDFVCSNYATVDVNTGYSLTVTLNDGNAENCRVYIDYNDDGSFAAGEQVYNSGSISGGVHTTTITIPAEPDVTGKILRMRIISDFNSITGGCNDVTYGEIEDYGIYINTPPCSAPAITSHPSNAGGCSGSNASFTVTASGTSKAYQWQVDTGSGYGNVSNGGVYSGATTASLTITGATGTHDGYKYRCYVSNGCGNATSNEATLSIYNTPTAACTPSTTNTGNFGTGVIRVQFNTIDNNHNDSNNDGTQDFTCAATTTVMPGSSHNITVTLVGTNAEFCKVFIDYNDDGDMDDAGELVYSSGSAAGSHSTTINIPSSPAVVGKILRMRVMSDFGGVGGACDNMAYGEAEDYGIIIPCAIPTISATSDGLNCGTGTVSIGATPSNGSIDWYTASTGGSSIGSGSSFTTPSISSTTTYYAEAVDGQCTSAARSAVTATIQNCQTALTSNATLSSLNEALNCTAVSGATNYRYLITHPATGFTTISVRGSSSTLFRMSWLSSGIKYGTTYNVQVAAYVNGQWESYGTTRTVTTPATKLISSDCGTTVATLDEELSFYPVAGATNYRIEVRHWGTSFYARSERGSANTNFRLSWITGATMARTYQVRIAAYVSGAWQSYGPYCTVTTPVPATKLNVASCGVSIPAMTSALYAEAVTDATNYRYKVMDGGSFVGLSVRGSSDNLFRLSWLTGTTTNKTYTVYVSAYANGMWGPYGDPCTVTTPAAMVANDLTNGEEATQYLGTASLIAYPNPNGGQFVVQSSQAGQFKIVNELGQLIKKIDITQETGLRYEVTDMARGVYFVSGTIDGELITRKVVVQ
ncbi:MAG: T9SS type A sorting domain-containing protein [Bacteroidetes bacterium]|nr:MAG: T9SS type A sorting domain-containing protein [Bacteroidota bacterium]